MIAWDVRPCSRSDTPHSLATESSCSNSCRCPTRKRRNAVERLRLRFCVIDGCHSLPPSSAVPKLIPRSRTMDNGMVVHAGAMKALADDEALQTSLLGLAL